MVRRSVAILLLFIIQHSWGAVVLSNHSIECCSLWESTLSVTKENGDPFPNCMFFVSAMEVRGGVDTTVSRYTYFTDSSGTAKISYLPKAPGEKLKISVSCSENKFETVLIVTGTADTPELPQLNIEFPSIEQSQMALVAFLIFAAVFVVKGKGIREAVSKIRSSGEAGGIKKEPVEELEMSPRRMILKHERKAAARLAKKYKRKEIRLGHQYLRRFD